MDLMYAGPSSSSPSSNHSCDVNSDVKYGTRTDQVAAKKTKLLALMPTEPHVKRLLLLDGVLETAVSKISNRLQKQNTTCHKTLSLQADTVSERAIVKLPCHYRDCDIPCAPVPVTIVKENLGLATRFGISNFPLAISTNGCTNDKN